MSLRRFGRDSGSFFEGLIWVEIFENVWKEINIKFEVLGLLWLTWLLGLFLG